MISGVSSQGSHRGEGRTVIEGQGRDLNVTAVDTDEYDEDEDEDDQSGNREPASPIESLAELVEFMVSNVVDDPSVVQVVPEKMGQNVHIKVIVPEEEMGRVIGRQGRIARSMRTLLTIAASRKGMRASLDIDS